MLSICVFVIMGNKVFTYEIMPKEWKQSLIIKIPKKGDTTQCDNYRGISLLSVPSKIFARAIINRLYDEVNMKLRQEQAGFRRGRNVLSFLHSFATCCFHLVIMLLSLYYDACIGFFSITTIIVFIMPIKHHFVNQFNHAICII